MKKLFMTSGLVLCMTCPAFAANDITPAGKDATNTNITANCTETYLDSYTGPVSLEAKWNPVISGQITLDSNRYASSSASSAATTADTTATPTPLYSVYGVGVYTTQPTEQTLANFTTSNRLQNLTTSGHLPEMTGYTFQGFYTGKAGSGTQVINASGVIQYDAASTQITSDESPNNTATWYAHWLAQTINITYSCGTAPSGASTGTTPGITGSAPAGASNVAFDSQYTLPSTPNTCALAGYHFKGWSCNYAIGTGTENSGYAAGSNTSALTYTATVTNNVGTIASGTSINAIKATSNVTCDAIWEANTVALTWDANGGSGATGGGGNCTYDGDITLPTAPTRNGYTFKGWTVCPGAHATAGSVVNGVCVNTACETGYHVDQTTHTCVVD